MAFLLTFWEDPFWGRKTSYEGSSVIKKRSSRTAIGSRSPFQIRGPFVLSAARLHSSFQRLCWVNRWRASYSVIFWRKEDRWRIGIQIPNTRYGRCKKDVIAFSYPYLHKLNAPSVVVRLGVVYGHIWALSVINHESYYLRTRPCAFLWIMAQEERNRPQIKQWGIYEPQVCIYPSALRIFEASRYEFILRKCEIVGCSGKKNARPPYCIHLPEWFILMWRKLYFVHHPQKWNK